tara:strand:- start:19 stop:600 length:582 start_codon:yes stop_codon:yes gene_type:complete
MTYHSNVIKRRDDKIVSVVDRVCEWHGLYPVRLWHESRKRQLVDARQEAWYLLRRNIRSLAGNKVSLSELGCIPNLWNLEVKWDHASVLHAVRTIEDRCSVDKTFNEYMIRNETVIKNMLKQFDIVDRLKDPKKPTLHYFEMLGHLTANLSKRHDPEEIDYLITKLEKKREKHATNQDPQQNLEMEMVQGTLD